MTELTKEELYTIYNDVSDSRDANWRQAKAYEKKGNDYSAAVWTEAAQKRDKLKKKLQKMIDEHDGRV